MPEVKTKTICAPAVQGPLCGKILRRPYDQDVLIYQENHGGLNNFTRHRYRLVPSLLNKNAALNDYFAFMWRYEGVDPDLIGE